MRILGWGTWWTRSGGQVRIFSCENRYRIPNKCYLCIFDSYSRTWMPVLRNEWLFPMFAKYDNLGISHYCDLFINKFNVVYSIWFLYIIVYAFTAIKILRMILNCSRINLSIECLIKRFLPATYFHNLFKPDVRRIKMSPGSYTYVNLLICNTFEDGIEGDGEGMVFPGCQTPTGANDNSTVKIFWLCESNLHRRIVPQKNTSTNE